MAEQYRFFNSTVGDVREYQASEFAEYFGKFIPDGVYIDNNVIGLPVTNDTGLVVNLGIGYANIRGYFYKNDASKAFTLDNADVVLNRIDRVVLKLDVVNKTMGAIVKKGTMGSTPVAPTLIDDANIKEIPIAQIRINANAASGIITDGRIAIPTLKDIGVRVLNGTVEDATIRVGDLWLKEV